MADIKIPNGSGATVKTDTSWGIPACFSLTVKNTGSAAITLQFEGGDIGLLQAGDTIAFPPFMQFPPCTITNSGGSSFLFWYF